MGQRLVIQNQINGESVNVSYYHWSAYTESSIEELKDFFLYDPSVQLPR